MNPEQLASWCRLFQSRVEEDTPTDKAHDVAHVRRVVANAMRLASREGAHLEVVIPAAWLHDLISGQKTSSERISASRKSAAMALAFLRKTGYPEELLPEIQHAIEAHSFSAGIQPTTIEAKVVQDADRLDALGAIGVARCFLTSTNLTGQKLYDEDDPFALHRDLDDSTYALDHFKKKLLVIATELKTETGREEGIRRAEFLQFFLSQFNQELRFAGGYR